MGFSGREGKGVKQVPAAADLWKTQPSRALLNCKGSRAMQDHLTAGNRASRPEQAAGWGGGRWQGPSTLFASVCQHSHCHALWESHVEMST